MILTIVIGLVALTLMLFLATVLIGAPYVPSHRRQLVDLFDNLYQLKQTDLVIDIGSGDGVVLAEVARRGAKALGYEINPVLVLISSLRLSKYRQQARVSLANFWSVDFPGETSLVYTFGESRDIDKMYRKVEAQAQRLNKTIYFVSYGFAVKNQRPQKTHQAHHLYKITPLQ